MATNPPATQADKKAAAQKKALYVVVSPLRHNGDEYAIGDEVELNEAEAAQLLGHTVKAKAKAADQAQ